MLRYIHFTLWGIGGVSCLYSKSKLWLSTAINIIDLDVAAEEGLEHLVMHHGRQEKLNATHQAAVEEACRALQVSVQAQRCPIPQLGFACVRTAK